MGYRYKSANIGTVSVIIFKVCTNWGPGAECFILEFQCQVVKFMSLYCTVSSLFPPTRCILTQAQHCTHTNGCQTFPHPRHKAVRNQLKKCQTNNQRTYPLFKSFSYVFNISIRKVRIGQITISYTKQIFRHWKNWSLHIIWYIQYIYYVSVVNKGCVVFNLKIANVLFYTFGFPPF